MTTTEHRTAVDPLADQGQPLGLLDAARVLHVLTALVGDVLVLGVRVDRDTIRVPVEGLPWPRLLRSVEVSVHCDDDAAAGQVGNRLGLIRTGMRRYASAVDGVQFVESRWTGWLTTGDAASVPLPVSVTATGAHPEPAPRPCGDEAGPVEAVA
jgi:hypothetical protein